MPKEYIEREALLADIEKTVIFSSKPAQTLAESRGANKVIDRIKAAPTANVVEVVRCRNCEHFTKGMAIGMCKRVPERPIIPMPYNAFCSFGKRKDGADNG